MENKLNIIVRMHFGSTLYGTNTPESDQDYKGVFLPSKREILLGRIPKSYNTSRKKAEGERNTSEDVDTEIYSLHYFIKLACEGQTVALDMLHAPDNMVIETSQIWKAIVENREKFYTKNLSAFCSYARGQVAKYGIKSGRLGNVKEVIKLLEKYEEIKLREIWDELLDLEHTKKSFCDKSKLRMYEIAGKKFQETASADYVLNCLRDFETKYGERARLAERNECVDWKSVSHALRAVYQVRQLLTENTITFPLKDAPYLKEVKAGRLDYMTEVAPTLEDLMDEVEELSKQSTLPDKVDRVFWDDFICEAIEHVHT